MKTDVISVSANGGQMAAALNMAEKVAVFKELSPKNTLHLRLLAEEMMGLMRSITGEKQAKFWIEDEDGVYQLHLQVFTRMDSEKRSQLLATATSGKNESARGLMGRLRDFFERGADEDIASLASPLILPEMYEGSSSHALDWEWSMIQYERALAPYVKRSDKAALEAWDELEKSVVAHVADDVKVSIKGDTVEMILVKKLS